MKIKSFTVEEAILMLNKGGQGSSAKEMFELSMQLKKEQAFGYARRILSLARKDSFIKYEMGIKLDQQCALCTYKDADLPLTDRLDQALHILREGRPDLDNTKNQETLGIAGAIYKRKWESEGQKQLLERALAYYIRGYTQGPENDNGYTGINAAFVLDLLALQENEEAAKSGTRSSDAKTHLKEADWIRNHIVETLSERFNKPGNELLLHDWWFLVTVAEALFGLQQYEEAAPWLKKAMAIKEVAEWQLETTTRQLARIALLQEPVDADKLAQSRAWQVLKLLIEDPAHETAALQTAFCGKVGLALSGGGFRASLYHIGVLARLAELDMLRRVEVLSCVSGGSIIGAHYYLAVRNLLESRTDQHITSQDYIDLVDVIAKDFLLGVQRNIRTRIASNFWCNFKMMWHPHYSRTERAGELYEKELFSRVKDGEEKTPRWLNHLFIHPLKKDGQKNIDFNPKYDNWRREAKIPILILNATALNTGHNWQFTASWMGESPASIQKADGNYRLRRMYYKEDGDIKYRRIIRLGYAVAASSCVPGMFEPLALKNLYPDKVIRLVDGGVHDNQGIIGLLEQDCSVLLVSDASGQMSSVEDPGSSVLGVPLRANNILMERVRNAQYQELNTRVRTGLLKGLLFVHLKMGLDTHMVDWVNCEDPLDDNFMSKPQSRLSVFNIRKDIQKRLAAIRTDLDSFNDTEAFALMTIGYLMTGMVYQQTIKGFPTPVDNRPHWFFLEITNDLRRPDAPENFMRLLTVAKERAFKIWRLSLPLRILAAAVALVLVFALIWAVIRWYDKPVITVGQIGWTIIWSVLGLVVGKTIIRIVRYRDTMIRFATGIGMISFGWLAANLHLLIFDKLYLQKGSRKKEAENTEEKSEAAPEQHQVHVTQVLPQNEVNT
ncbi:MAG: tetratricopeptide repeat-containing protein [Chitinophagaceae bacterium]